jgi:hypothetical protein
VCPFLATRARCPEKVGPKRQEHLSLDGSEPELRPLISHQARYYETTGATAVRDIGEAMLRLTDMHRGIPAGAKYLTLVPGGRRGQMQQPQA